MLFLLKKYKKERRMLKTMCVPSNDKITIDIPQKYIGKNVEIIMYSFDDIETNKEKKVHFTDFGFNAAYKFDREEVNER
jgi:hypothetical protein